MNRRSVVGLLVFVLLATPAIVVIWTQVVPVYRATGEIRVCPVMSHLVFPRPDNGRIPFYGSYVNTQASIVKCPRVLNRALDRPDVQRTQWYDNPSQSLVERLFSDAVLPLDRLKKGLSARPRPETEILGVAFTDPRADDAVVIVDAVLEEYIKCIGENSNVEHTLIYQQLTERKNAFEAKISGREALIARLQKSLGTARPDEWLPARRRHLDTLERQLEELQRSIDLLEWETEQLNDGDDDKARSKPATGPMYHEDVEWRQLDTDVRKREHELAKDDRGPNHPDVQEAKKDLAFAKELRQRRESQLDEQWRHRARTAAETGAAAGDPNRPIYAEDRESLEHELARAKRQEQGLRAEIKGRQREFEKAFETTQLLEAETRRLKHERELYEAVRARLDQMNMERNVPSPISILAQASRPAKPYRDRRILYTAIALVAALMLGCGAGLLVRKGRAISPAGGFAERPEEVGE